MTKKELIKRLHEHGELWASEKHSKAYLEKYLYRVNDAKSMSLSELAEMIGFETETKNF